MNERAACPRLFASDIVMSCCRCLCFRSSSLSPPLSKELYVGTYGVNLQHEGSISELQIVQRVFLRAREDRTIVFAKNNMCNFNEHDG
jgi:hypothetical protein